MKNRWQFIIVLCYFGLKLSAQDIHFSQFTENPSLVNPALTGALSSIRVSVTNKDQWRSIGTPYKTSGASFEMRFKSQTWEKVDGKSMTFKESISRVAAGLSFYKDKVGDGNLGQTQVNLSLADFIALNQYNFISIGLQGSYVQRMIDNNRLIFPDQYNGNVYDPNQVSSENFTNLKFAYFDLGSGVQWTYSNEKQNMNSNKQLTSHLGFAVYHISKPRQEYFETLTKLDMKYVLHGDVIMSLRNGNMAISPSYLIQLQGSTKEIIIGTVLRQYLKTDSKYTGIIKRNSFGYGIYYRYNDAVLFSGLLEWREQFAAIVSYDLNVSSLSTVSSFRGGLELTLRYTAPKFSHYQRK